MNKNEQWEIAFKSVYVAYCLIHSVIAAWMLKNRNDFFTSTTWPLTLYAITTQRLLSPFILHSGSDSDLLCCRWTIIMNTHSQYAHLSQCQLVWPPFLKVCCCCYQTGCIQLAELLLECLWYHRGSATLQGVCVSSSGAPASLFGWLEPLTACSPFNGSMWLCASPGRQPHCSALVDCQSASLLHLVYRCLVWLQQLVMAKSHTQCL